MARPKAIILRTEQLHFRVTRLERRVIERKAIACGMNVAEFVRNSALGKEVGYRLTPEEVEAFRNLVQLRTNWSRLGSLIRERKEFTHEVRELILLTNQLIGKFKK